MLYIQRITKALASVVVTIGLSLFPLHVLTKRGHIIAYLGLANLCVWLFILYQFKLIG
jgi:hypothetical protein